MTLKACRFTLLIFFVSFLIQLSCHQGALAQFGVPKGEAAEADVGADGQVRLPEDVLAVAESLITTDPSLSQQDAVDIATVINAAKNDKDTKVMLMQMKAENAEAFAGTENLPKLEIVKGLEQAFEELKMVDVLFQDKERAFREMDKEGLIEKEKYAMYQNNPDLLESDTRKGLYVMFAALAEAAGYL